MNDSSARLDALERRLESVEDKWEILTLLASYGPAVDSGSSDAAAEIWLENGTYDVDSGFLDGRGGIRSMVSGSTHQGFIQGGSAHIMGTPHIELDGDTAVVVGHTLLVLRSPGPAGEFGVARITANRWELVKDEGTWRVNRRVGRLLDGNPEARAVLGGTFPNTDSVDGGPVSS